MHLGLLALLAAALGTLQLLHVRNAIHADVGLASPAWSLSTWHSVATGLLGCCAQLVRFRPRVERELRLLASDAILTFITINVVVSGILDWGRGAPLLLPLPQPFEQVAPDLVCRARRVPGRPRLAPVETPPTLHDPIALWSTWCLGERTTPAPSEEGRGAKVVVGLRPTASHAHG